MKNFLTICPVIDNKLYTVKKIHKERIEEL